MADIFPKNKRSDIMSRIRGKDTKPEIIIRRALHHKGYRFRKNDSSLPGKPDIKLTKYNAIIQINGCFWHGHYCHIFKPPKSKKEFWQMKISRNRDRDKKNNTELLGLGWRVLIVWECAIMGKTKLNGKTLMKEIESWLLHGENYREITGIESGN